MKIGDPVRICGNHPHAGKHGTIAAIEQTAAGPGVRIKLDVDWGEPECFVFDVRNLAAPRSTTPKARIVLTEKERAEGWTEI